MSLKISDLFTVQITAVSHGYVIRTTKGEAFAYETKEALLNAFTDMFGIHSPVSSNVLRDLRAEGSTDIPGSYYKKGQHVLKPEVKEKEMDKFKEADPFPLKNHQKH
ncbi:MAG: hypothetical protein D4R88_05015, partial [Methanosarcinales archaeon]